MTKPEAIKALKLLSALESWGFSTSKPLPSFLDDTLLEVMGILERIILEKK